MKLKKQEIKMLKMIFDDRYQDVEFAIPLTNPNPTTRVPLGTYEFFGINKQMTDAEKEYCVNLKFDKDKTFFNTIFIELIGSVKHVSDDE